MLLNSLKKINEPSFIKIAACAKVPKCSICIEHFIQLSNL